MAKLEGRGRVKYPKFDRPILKIERYSFEVLDLSASGVKFKGNTELKLNRKDDYIVEIITMSERPIQTKAKFVRSVGDLFALVFVKHLPDSLIEKEHDRLFKKYGGVDVKS